MPASRAFLLKRRHFCAPLAQKSATHWLDLCDDVHCIKISTSQYSNMHTGVRTRLQLVSRVQIEAALSASRSTKLPAQKSFPPCVSHQKDFLCK
jgi:hypothetical protein